MSFDSNFYYRLSTMFRGNKINLDIYNGGEYNNMPHLTNEENFSGQYWSIQPSKDTGYYHLSTMFRGSEMCLDVYNGGKYNNMLHLVPKANYSGQFWKIEASVQAGYFSLSTMFRGAKVNLDIYNGGEYNNMPHLVNEGNFSGQYWLFEKTNQRIYSSNFANLAPSKSFMNNVTNIKELSSAIQNFNRNLNMNTYINTLTGKAEEIAIDIRNNLAPKVEKVGLSFENSITSTEQDIGRFGTIMVQVCELLKKKSLDKTQLSNQLKLALALSKHIQNNFKANISPSLDQYHKELNLLVSQLGSEKIAIQDNNQSLEQQRNQIIQKMHARTHTVCGVVKMIWDSVTFQLEGELRDENEELARLRFQFNANSMAIGGASYMINVVKSFESELEGLSQYWDEFSSTLESLILDIDGLLLVHEHDMTNLYIQLIESDWASIKTKN